MNRSLDCAEAALVRARRWITLAQYAAGLGILFIVAHETVAPWWALGIGAAAFVFLDVQSRLRRRREFGP